MNGGTDGNENIGGSSQYNARIEPVIATNIAPWIPSGNSVNNEYLMGDSMKAEATARAHWIP